MVRTRSGIESKMWSLFPHWKYCTDVQIAYSSFYIPDMDTGKYYLEIKGTMDKKDRAKLIRVQTALSSANGIHIRYPDTLTDYQKNLLNNTLQELRSQGVSIYPFEVQMGIIKPLVLAPYLSTSKAMDNWQQVPGAPQGKDVISGLEIVKWAKHNNVPVAPWNESRIEAVRQYDGKAHVPFDSDAWDSSSLSKK